MKKESTTIDNGNSVNFGNAARPVTPNEVYDNKGLIMEVGHRLGWDFNSCEDLVQEVAYNCWSDRRIAFNPSKGTLAGYLARIARNTAVDIWRKNRHNPVPTDHVELMKMMEDEEVFTDDVEEQEERHALLERGIVELYRSFPSKEGNDAFVMFSRDGMHAKEVAQKLGVDERFVNVAVHRGLKRLTDIVRRLKREDLEMQVRMKNDGVFSGNDRNTLKNRTIKTKRQFLDHCFHRRQSENCFAS